MKLICFFVTFFFCVFSSFSQYDLTTSNGQTITLSTCSATLSDPGGSGNYSNNQNKSIIIQASNASDHVKILFSMLKLGSSSTDGDIIEVYDDPASTKPVSTIKASDLTYGFDPIFISKANKLKIVFKSDASGVNQGFLANLSCVSGSVSSISSSGTINSCSGIITDDGGISGKYLPNKTYTKTICSNDGSKIRLEFVNNTSIHRLDKLVIYDGSTVITGKELIQLGGVISSELDKYISSSPGMGDFPEKAFINTKSTFDQVKVQSSGTCVTLQWVSDGTSNTYSDIFDYTGNSDINEDGFSILYSCSKEPLNVPGNFCETAYTICDLNGVEGITSSFYAATYSGSGTGKFCPSGFDPCTSMSSSMSVENNSFVKFVANSSTATFKIEVPFCFDGTSGSGYSGIQVRVFDGTSCSSFSTPVSGNMNVIMPSTSSIPSASLSPYSLICSGLTVGKTYVIVIDGYGGSICGYRITTSSGILLADAGQDQSVCSSTATLAAKGTGFWSSTAINTSATVTSVNSVNSGVSGLKLGSNKFVWNVSGACSSVTDTVDIVSISTSSPTLTNKGDVCKGTTGTFTITGTAGDKISYSGVTASSASPVTIPASGTIDVTVSNITERRTFRISESCK